MSGLDRQSTVLVVDDEKGLADIYSKHLAETYTVRTAYSGNEALDVMNLDIDVVLLDRRMPDRSGGDVLTAIRSRGYDCPVVFLTAVEPDLEVLSLDFDEYLTKPVSAEDLHDIVEAMMARRAYLAKIQEAVALASRMATLEAKMDLDVLEASTEYTETQRRFDELRGEIGTPPSEGLYSDLAQEKLQILFE